VAIWLERPAPRPQRASMLHGDLSGISVDDFSYYRVLAVFKLCVVFQQLYVRRQHGNMRAPRAAEFSRLIDGLIDVAAHTLSIQRLLT
jgi:aminoglycoside phosphotransferase (APT) family kinase protein